MWAVGFTADESNFGFFVGLRPLIHGSSRQLCSSISVKARGLLADVNGVRLIVLQSAAGLCCFLQYVLDDIYVLGRFPPSLRVWDSVSLTLHRQQFNIWEAISDYNKNKETPVPWCASTNPLDALPSQEVKNLSY